MADLAKEINIDQSLEIKPGLILPDGVGFYSLEGKLIYEMKQTLAVSKLSKGREVERILSGVPLIPRKMTMEIPDAHAALRLITAEPEFYMRPADEREPRFRLLRVQVKGSHRLVENISIHITGEQTHQADDIDFQTWTPARGVFRYTVNQRLEPGEYAFVEMTNRNEASNAIAGLNGRNMNGRDLNVNEARPREERSGGGGRPGGGGGGNRAGGGGFNRGGGGGGRSKGPRW